MIHDLALGCFIALRLMHAGLIWLLEGQIVLLVETNRGLVLQTLLGVLSRRSAADS